MLQVEHRFLWEKTVSRQPCDEIVDKVVERAVPRMFDLRHVLQFIVDALYDGSLAQQHLVRDRHQRVLHSVLQLRYQLDSVDEQPAEQLLSDISSVTHQLSVDVLNETAAFQRFAVINIAGGEHEIDNLAFLIAYQMQLETEEPSHGAFASLCQSLEGPVLQYALVAAHAKRRAVYETDASALAHQHCLDEDDQLDHSDFLQLHKTIIRDHFREQVAHIITNMLVEMFQASETGAVERYHDGHHL